MAIKQEAIPSWVNGNLLSSVFIVNIYWSPFFEKKIVCDVGGIRTSDWLLIYYLNSYFFNLANNSATIYFRCNLNNLNIELITTNLA